MRGMGYAAELSVPGTNRTATKNVPNRPTTNQNLANRPTTNQNLANRSATNQNLANRSTTNQNLANRSATNQNLANRSATNQNLANRSATNQNLANRPATNQNLANRPATNPNLANRPAANPTNQGQTRRYDFSMEPSVADIPSPTRNVKVNDTPNAIMTTNNDWVTEHNRIRGDVGQKPVKWNQTLANAATDYANKCVFQHANQRAQGENLAMGSPSSRYDDKTMVRLWESEKKDYRHPQPPRITSPGETGHYTQMVNKNVSEIGCGCANCGKSRMCVCLYDRIQYGSQPPY